MAASLIRPVAKDDKGEECSCSCRKPPFLFSGQPRHHQFPLTRHPSWARTGGQECRSAGEWIQDAGRTTHTPSHIGGGVVAAEGLRQKSFKRPPAPKCCDPRTKGNKQERSHKEEPGVHQRGQGQGGMGHGAWTMWHVAGSLQQDEAATGEP